MTPKRTFAGLLTLALLVTALATVGKPLVRNMLFGIAYEIDGN